MYQHYLPATAQISFYSSELLKVPLKSDMRLTCIFYLQYVQVFNKLIQVSVKQ